MTLVGKDVPHDSARGHVTGESVFIDDMPFARNEVQVGYFGSPQAHCKIRALHLEAARKIPGVIGLYTYQDIPGKNRFGPIIQDELLLAEDTAVFYDQPIVLIAAESLRAIYAAKAAIQIEVEALEPVFTIEDALERQEFLGDRKVIERGNLEAAFQAADHVLEGTFVIGGQEQFYLENQSAIAYPGENGAITVHSSTQNPTEVQEVIAGILGLGQHQVVCITKRMGGAFGGKECQATHYAAMASLVAQKTGRPARMVLNKDDDMRITGKRHPYRNTYKVAFTQDGEITGLAVDFYSNGGAYADLSTAVMGRTVCHAENAYYIPNIAVTGTVCRTNLPPNTAFRGFGGPQGVITMENIIEEIAVFLKKDACEIREINCYGADTRNITPYGQEVKNNWLPEIFKRLKASAQYDRRMAEMRAFNAKSPTHLKGLSLTPVKFGISFNTKFLNQGSALVNIYLDGTIQVSTGGTEMGQGINTKIRQLVAEEFSVDLDGVILMPTSTEKNNNSSATAASSGTDINGSAAVNACRKIKDRLTAFAADSLADETLPPSAEHIVFENGSVYDSRRPQTRIRFKDLVHKAYLERISLGERGFYATPGLEFTWETGQGTPFLYFTTGCAVSEVLIDRFTGDLTVERCDILMDIGRPINPGIDRGQIVGAFIQGMGWVTTEELKYADNGDLLSHSPTTYKIPNIQDIPRVFNVDWVDNPDNLVNLRQSKAVGEPPLLLAASVWTAVKHALSFVSNGEIPQLEVPATNEEILTRILYYTRKYGKSPGASPETSEPLLT